MSHKYPDEFEDLDFEIVEEHWNEYELDEGNCQLRGRVIINKIISDPNNQDLYAFEFAPVIFSVNAPLSIRGERNNQPKQEEYNTLPRYEVKIKRADEKYNRYRILKNDTIIKVRLIVSEVTRLQNRFDENGIPFYIMNYSYDIPKVKPKSKNALLP